MLSLNNKGLALVAVAGLKIRFFSRPYLIIYKAYAVSQKCAPMHDATAYVCVMLKTRTPGLSLNIQLNHGRFRYHIRW